MLENALRFMTLADANVRFVLFGSLLIGATGGLLGSFAVLRQRSLVGDALAHAALPGVALAYLWTGSKALPVLLAGATVSGVLGVLLMQFIINFTRIKADAAIGIVLSVFFGIGSNFSQYIHWSNLAAEHEIELALFTEKWTAKCRAHITCIGKCNFSFIISINKKAECFIIYYP